MAGRTGALASRVSGSCDRELVRTRTVSPLEEAITAAGQCRIHTGLRSPVRIGSVATGAPSVMPSCAVAQDQVTWDKVRVVQYQMSR